MQELSNRSGSNQPRGMVLPAGILVLFLLLLHSSAWAAWYKDYEDAMEFIEKGQNTQAIPLLQSAIGQKNEEGANIKFYGMKFGDYFPHYYLGMAYFSQKNYDAAIREFEASERFGQIHRKAKLYEKMNSVRTLARAQLSIQKEPDVATNKPPDTTPSVTIPVVTPPTEEPKKEEKKPETTVKDLPVQKPPVTVAETTTPIKKEESKPPVVTTPVAPVPDPGSEAKVMVKNGARKYFEGDFDAAISYLTDALEANPKEPAAHFLLGCAYASKYLLTGSDNKELLQNASAAFQRLKKINPSFQPRNKSYFSPAVLDLYART